MEFALSSIYFLVVVFVSKRIHNFSNTSEGYAIRRFNKYIEFTILSSRRSEALGEGEGKLNICLSRNVFCKIKTPANIHDRNHIYIFHIVLTMSI